MRGSSGLLGHRALAGAVILNGGLRYASHVLSVTFDDGSLLHWEQFVLEFLSSAIPKRLIVRRGQQP